MPRRTAPRSLAAVAALLAAASPLVAQTTIAPPTGTNTLQCTGVSIACGQSFTVPTDASRLGAWSFQYASNAAFTFKIEAVDGGPVLFAQEAPAQTAMGWRTFDVGRLALAPGASYRAYLESLSPSSVFLGANATDVYAGGTAQARSTGPSPRWLDMGADLNFRAEFLPPITTVGQLGGTNTLLCITAREPIGCGQSFTAPLDATALESFAFEYDARGDVTFNLVEFDGDAPGALLFSQAAPAQVQRALRTFDLSALSLTGGRRYLAYLESTERVTLGSFTSDVYAGGSARARLTGTPPRWIDMGADLSFQANFRVAPVSTVPEPTTVALLATGLAAIGVGARRSRTDRRV